MNENENILTCADCAHWSDTYITQDNPDRSSWCKHKRSEDLMRYLLNCVEGQALVSAEDCHGFKPGKQEVML